MLTSNLGVISLISGVRTLSEMKGSAWTSSYFTSPIC